MTWIVFLGGHLKKVWFHKVNQRYWNVGCRLNGWISTILAAFFFLNNILLCMTDRQCHTITVDVTQCSKMSDLIRKFENGQVSDIQLFSSWYLSEPIYFVHFNVRHPVCGHKKNRIQSLARIFLDLNPQLDTKISNGMDYLCFQAIFSPALLNKQWHLFLSNWASNWTFFVLRHFSRKYEGYELFLKNIKRNSE